MNKTLSVQAIKNGTVIDHIPAGQGVKILRLLDLYSNKTRVFVGLNLEGKKQQKDLIKMEDTYLSDAEIQQIAIFAKDATINYIKNFEVDGKSKVDVPTSIKEIFSCPNSNCITRSESVVSEFKVHQVGKSIALQCKYCEKSFDHEDLESKL